MRRSSLAAALLVVLALVLAPSRSYAQQSLNFYFGGFVPPSADGRSNDDVLANNLNFLAFDIGEFHGPTFGAEYLVGLGQWLDGGLGIGYYSQTVKSVYADYVNANGSEIEQDLRLRMTPFTATVRFLPLGRSAGIEPYVGAGVAIINWQYREAGDFVDFTDGSIFGDRFTGSGTSTGPLILGGVRAPLGDAFRVGGEIRWQKAEGDLPLDQGFSGDTVDLGGWSYLATFNVRF